jgi:hypothetical protein
MKKIIGIILALMMCFVFAIPAMAQDEVVTDQPDAVVDSDGIAFTATKSIDITESLSNDAQVDVVGYFDKMKYITIDTFKHINIDFTNEISVNSDGEAETFGYQINMENWFEDMGITKESETVTTSEELVKDPNVNPQNDRWTRYTTVVTTERSSSTEFIPNERTALIDPSINDNDGFIGVNQSPGNMNNQANASAAAVIAGDAQLIEANGFAVQASLFNFIYSDQSVNMDIILDSINGNSGIVGVNQSTGNMNNQFNSAALAAGLNPETTGALG